MEKLISNTLSKINLKKVEFPQMVLFFQYLIVGITLIALLAR